MSTVTGVTLETPDGHKHKLERSEFMAVVGDSAKIASRDPKHDAMTIGKKLVILEAYRANMKDIDDHNLRKRCEELKKENAVLRDLVKRGAPSVIDEELQNLRREIRSCNAEKEALQKLVETHEAVAAATQNSSISNEIQAQIQGLRNDLEESEKQVFELKKALEDAQKKTDESEKKLADTKEKCANAITDLQGQITKHVQTLQNEQQDREKQVSELKNALEDAQKKTDESEKKLTDTKEKCVNAITDLEGQITKHVQELQNEQQGREKAINDVNQICNNRVSELEKELDEAESEIEKLTNRIKALERAVDDGRELERSYDALKAQNQQLSKQIDQLQDDLTNLRTRLEEPVPVGNFEDIKDKGTNEDNEGEDESIWQGYTRPPSPIGDFELDTDYKWGEADARARALPATLVEAVDVLEREKYTFFRDSGRDQDLKDAVVRYENDGVWQAISQFRQWDDREKLILGAYITSIIDPNTNLRNWSKKTSGDPLTIQNAFDKYSTAFEGSEIWEFDEQQLALRMRKEEGYTVNRDEFNSWSEKVTGWTGRFVIAPQGPHLAMMDLPGGINSVPRYKMTRYLTFLFDLMLCRKLPLKLDPKTEPYESITK